MRDGENDGQSRHRRLKCFERNCYRWIIRNWRRISVSRKILRIVYVVYIVPPIYARAHAPHISFSFYLSVRVAVPWPISYSVHVLVRNNVNSRAPLKSSFERHAAQHTFILTMAMKSWSHKRLSKSLFESSRKIYFSKFLHPLGLRQRDAIFFFFYYILVILIIALPSMYNIFGIFLWRLEKRHEHQEKCFGFLLVGFDAVLLLLLLYVFSFPFYIFNYVALVLYPRVLVFPWL